MIRQEMRANTLKRISALLNVKDSGKYPENHDTFIVHLLTAAKSVLGTSSKWQFKGVLKEWMLRTWDRTIMETKIPTQIPLGNVTGARLIDTLDYL